MAELTSGVLSAPLLPTPDALRECALRADPKRMPWAERSGPQASLAWAQVALNARGYGELSAVQQRTWNLSTLWRLEPRSASGPTFWLKQVPRFMKHEGAVLRWLNETLPDAAPTLVAADDNGRSLLADVPGADLYGAPPAMRKLINEQLHAIQSAAAGATHELLTLGVPDLRGARRSADIRRKLTAWCADYPGLNTLLVTLDQQLERLEACGLPATLVHSDNHPGNARGSDRGVRLLDWGEAFIGDPVTDLLGALAGLAQPEAAPLIADWCANWKRVAPDSNPERAFELAPFIAAMHGAATYAHFLQQIEASEWPYHRADVPRCLEQARALLPRH